MNKCGRSGKDRNTQCKKKKGEKTAKAELHLEALSDSEDRAWGKKRDVFCMRPG